MTVVVKISGKPIAEPEKAGALWSAFSEAPRGTVVVHGGGVQVDALFDRLGIAVERRDGIRLTPAEHMPLVAAVLAGEVNQALVGLLRSSGARAVGLSLASAGVVEAEVDPAIGGRVGRVTGGDGSTLAALASEGLLPVVASIAADKAGGLLNINADDAAAGIAAALGASRLVLLTDVEGVLDGKGERIEELASSQVEPAIASGEIRGGMAAKVRAAAGLADRLGCEILIAGWQNAREAIAGAGTGTVIRPSKADQRNHTP